MQILLGGLITLVVTVIVQIVVIPLVQRRTRRLERWEDALIELVDIHDVQMGAPLDRHSGAVIFLALEEDKLARGDPGGSQDKVDAARQELYDAWDAVGELWHRFSWLQKRVYLVSQGAPHWSWMERVTWDFDKEFRALNPRPREYRLPPDMEVQDASTRRLAELHDDVGEVIHRVSDTMRPPPTYPWRRWWILTTWHARRLTGTLNPAPPPFDFDAALSQMWEDLDRKKLKAGGSPAPSQQGQTDLE